MTFYDKRMKCVAICKICQEIIEKCFSFVGFIDVKFNYKTPGLIFKCNTCDFNYTTYIMFRLTERKVMHIFDVKEYNSSVHVNLKKEYINKAKDLETLLKIQGIL